MLLTDMKFNRTLNYHARLAAHMPSEEEFAFSLEMIKVLRLAQEGFYRLEDVLAILPEDNSEIYPVRNSVLYDLLYFVVGKSESTYTSYNAEIKSITEKLSR